MGIDRYIEQQLHPETIADTGVEARLQNLQTLRMTTAELYAKFPQPGKIVRQLQRKGELPADLAALRKNGGAQNNPNAAAASNADAAKEMSAAAGEMTTAQQSADATMPNGGKQEYRAALRDYYMQNNLQLPQRIVAELQASRILRAVYSERQLQEEMVDFWTNHFNVFAGKGADKWMLTAYDRDTIRPNALGKFRDLLIADAQSPAMLFYLDNFQSVSPNAPQGGGQFRRRALMNNQSGAGGQFVGGFNNKRAQRLNRFPNTASQAGPSINMPPPPQAAAKQPKQAKRGINENYARELMELHTLGVDGGYTQHDVQEVARCFTGWTIRKPNDEGLFLFNPATHDNAEKIVLGQKIPAGGGISDAERVLDILARHTSTAHFIATKLARRFISDDPSAFVVNRAADVFLKTDGSIRETLRSIITSPEFFARAAYRAKTRSPFEYAVAATRTLEADTNGDRPMLDWIARMGESLFGRLTPDGYPDRADQWLSTGNLLQRFNFANALAANKIRGTSVNASRLLQGIDSGDASHIAEHLAQLALAGDITPQTKAALASSAAAFQKPTQANALSQATTATATLAAPQSVNNLVSGNANHTAANKTATAAAALPVPPLISELLTLVIGSPEFQRR
jgi:uncharacterized protein (DUF1800 family)